ncbi:hypothetical protein Pint_19664 [Pistacia integerrima]|uniref:Uncharacterized protein n=1 Tax=Pistacia integerrima TaxID=434235 RepID=A0ACC0XD88_9ROSI|nr:hypothetical protein Pint_19664 [Pistacia integerrima]
MDSRILTLTLQQLLGRWFQTLANLEIFEFEAIVDALTTNQLLPMLRDVAILVLQELRGLAPDDGINPGGGDDDDY